MPKPLQYRLERTRQVQRKWLQAIKRTGPPRAVSAPQPNDIPERGGCCPACGASAPVAPIRSVYRGHGLIDHHRICASCGHEWTASVSVPS